MISLFTFLLESSILMTLFYAFYFILLRNEKTFIFNRFYLLVSTLLAVSIPFLSLEFFIFHTGTLNKSISAFQEWQSNSLETITVINENPVNGFWIRVLLSIYIGGIGFTLFRLLLAIRKVWLLTKNHPITIINNIPVVQVKESIPPFSFLKYAFINTSIFNADSFEQILTHEKVHIEQKHSYDLLYIEFLACFYWFNPIIWRISRSIKASHEYIADNNIINYGFSSVEYQSLLLEQIMNRQSNKLLPHFNLSFIKKRITMMNSKKSKTFNFLQAGTVGFAALLLTLVALNYHSLAKIPNVLDQINPYTIMLDSKEINLGDGIDYSSINKNNFNGNMTIYFRDINPTPQTQLVFTLVGKVEDTFRAKASVKVEKIKDWNQISSLKTLFTESESGDILNIEIKGLDVKWKYFNIPIK